jgi:putative phosphoribosyl transferase
MSLPQKTPTQSRTGRAPTSFRDRREAGRSLAQRLSHLAQEPGRIVLALPRGGVPVAFEVAAALDAPLDVFIVRKLGVPGHEELAMGAIASGGIVVENEDVLKHLPLRHELLRAVSARETEELRRREALYRGEAAPMAIDGRTVIVVDDGLATGATMRAAVEALRRQRPRRLVVAVPVAAPDASAAMRRIADEVVCVIEPRDLRAVGIWYDDFTQTTDREVQELLARARRISSSAATPHPVAIGVGDVQLLGDLTVPDLARGVVLFAHGSGSGRLSPRNRHVANALTRRSMATLLVDLLTEQEERVDERTRELRFDIALLAKRLGGAVEWLGAHAATEGLPVGLFGASTGGGAALVTAAQRPERIAAVVSRGGRPDLASDLLPLVRCPTLLVVGALDTQVIALNRAAMAEMRSEVSLVVVPGATHLFEQPGALERVASLAGDWFLKHFPEPVR